MNLLRLEVVLQIFLIFLSSIDVLLVFLVVFVVQIKGIGGYRESDFKKGTLSLYPQLAINTSR